MSVQESDQAVLANLMRRVLTENAHWSVNYRHLYGDLENPVNGVGISLETDLDLTVEEYFAAQRAMELGTGDE